MRDISYRIVTYDPQEIDLMSITQKSVTDFLQIVGLKLSPETIECKGCDELKKEWEKLGTYEDKQFRGQLSSIYRKATKHLPSLNLTHRAILVTSKYIGDIVGFSYNWILILSSNKISCDHDTIATAIYHELGHTHGIPDEKRKCIGNYEKSNINDVKIVDLEYKHKNKNAIFYWKGEHCLNIGCSMRQRLCFDNWKRHLTEERLPGKPYCDKCLADLKRFKNTLDYNKVY